MRREKTYIKPNMANLRGRNGREIIRFIRNTPPADLTHLKEEAEKCRKELMEQEKNGNPI